jgi:hypothetical protein
VTPEGRVKAGIKAWLTERRIWFYMPVQNGMGVAGIPDIIACWHGRFIAIECKAPGKAKNTTKLQDFQLASIRESGGYAFVTDSLEHFVEAMSLLELVTAKASAT